MRITVESQTVAALVNVSKYSLKSAFDHCSRAEGIPRGYITIARGKILHHLTPLK